MNSSPPTLTGFNNNVRYRGMRFHIQTEDSGVTRPHITTHLFADGGHVIKSLRTDYAQYVDHPERVSLVQRLMREQHRAMALELRDGKLDATIDRFGPPAPEAEESEPAPTTQLSARPPAPLASGERGLVSAPGAPASVAAAPVVVAPVAAVPAAAEVSKKKPAQSPPEAEAPASSPAAPPQAASDDGSGSQVGKADSQPLWDTQLRPKGRGRRRSNEPRSSRRAPASSAGKSSAPRSRSAASTEAAEPSSSRRPESQRGQNQRPSSRSGAASSQPKARKSDRSASAPAASSEAPASSRRSGSSRAARGATGSAEPPAAEPAVNSSRRSSRSPRTDVTEPQPSSAPSSSRRGRPAAALPVKPGGPSLFGPLPQDSLDDAILTYAARAKTPPSSRGSK